MLTTYGNARQSVGSILSLRSPQQRHDSAQYSAYSQSNDHNSSIASQENSRRYVDQGGSHLRRSAASGLSGQYADDRHYRGAERSASNATNDFFEGDGGNFNHNFDNKFFEGTSQCSDHHNESSGNGEFLRSNDQASPRQDRRRRQSGTSVGSEQYAEDQRIAAQWQTPETLWQQNSQHRYQKQQT